MSAPKSTTQKTQKKAPEEIVRERYGIDKNNFSTGQLLYAILLELVK